MEQRYLLPPIKMQQTMGAMHVAVLIICLKLNFPVILAECEVTMFKTSVS